VFAILRLIATNGVLGGVLGGALKARLQAAKRTAAAVSALVVVGLIVSTVGLACLAGALYLALLRVMADYEAALAVGGGFIALAGIVLLLAVAKARRGFSTGRRSEEGAAAPVPPRVKSAASAEGSDPLVALIGESVQSPVVMSALALGVVVGRMTRRSKRD
jgi:hypothetical protein